jgi:hypothetical protein
LRRRLFALGLAKCRFIALSCGSRRRSTSRSGRSADFATSLKVGLASVPGLYIITATGYIYR